MLPGTTPRQVSKLNIFATILLFVSFPRKFGSSFVSFQSSHFTSHCRYPNRDVDADLLCGRQDKGEHHKVLRCRSMDVSKGLVAWDV